MKSRWTTWLLAGVVVLIWGVIGWKIFYPSGDNVSRGQKVLPPVHPAPEAAEDTLQCDYADPFTRGTPAILHAATRNAVRSLPPKSVQVRREKVHAVHLGTISVQGDKLYILLVDGAQYELRCGEPAGDFVLSGCDADSLYLEKQGLKYGVKLCE